MFDFEDSLKTDVQGNTDIVFRDTFAFKIRNLLNIRRGENPYQPQVGFSADLLMRQEPSRILIENTVSSYLSRFRAPAKSVNFYAKNKEKGEYILEVITDRGEALNVELFG